MIQPSRTIRRWLRAPGEPQPFLRSSLYYERARQAVWAFYLVSAVNSFALMPIVHSDAEFADGLNLVWPVLWLGETSNVLAWADFFALTTLLFALLATWKPDNRIFRIMFAFGLLLCGAFWSSFGGINHVYHAWFWAAFALVFLPSGNGRATKLTYLLVFASSQALILLFYSLAGLFKTYYGIRAIISGDVGNFSTYGFALTLADRVVQTGTQPLLADFMIQNPALSWPAFIVLIYVQLVAVVIVYRPRLHVLWGIALIGFHIGTWLLMEIASPQHFLVVLTLIAFSPFRPVELLSWKAMKDLPIFGYLFKALA